MSKKIPPEIMHLLEKRTLPDRRKKIPEPPSEQAAPVGKSAVERRQKTRRKAAKPKRSK